MYSGLSLRPEYIRAYVFWSQRPRGRGVLPTGTKSPWGQPACRRREQCEDMQRLAPRKRHTVEAHTPLVVTWAAELRQPRSYGFRPISTGAADATKLKQTQPLSRWQSNTSLRTQTTLVIRVLRPLSRHGLHCSHPLISKVTGIISIFLKCTSLVHTLALVWEGFEMAC